MRLQVGRLVVDLAAAGHMAGVLDLLIAVLVLGQRTVAQSLYAVRTIAGVASVVLARIRLRASFAGRRRYESAVHRVRRHTERRLGFHRRRAAQQAV